MEFQINGVDSKTGEDRALTVSADSKKEALAAAKAQGVLASNVKLLGTTPAQLTVFEAPNDASFANVFNRYLNRTIGVNYRDAEKIESAELVSVTEEHFSVYDSAEELVYHFPMRMVLSVTEPRAGGEVSTGFFSKKHCLVVRVFHMVIYKGAVGVSWSF